MFTIPNEAQAAYAAQAEPDSGDLAILAAAFGGAGHKTGCAVTQRAAGANMSVDVASGTVIQANIPATVAAANLAITTADPTNPRIDLVTAGLTGALVVTAGVPAAHPAYPAIPAASVVLASVYVPAAATSITTSMILDKRVTLTPPGPDYLAADYGAVRASRGTGGVSTATTAFSDTAGAFTSADQGKLIFIRGAVSTGNRSAWATTIAAVGGPTSITLTTAPPTSGTSLEYFYGPDQSSAIQAAIDAAALSGGGRVVLSGAYPIASSLVLKNRVHLEGAWKKATTLFAARGITGPVIVNLQGDPTLGGSASYCGVRELAIDGCRLSNTAISTTLNGALSAGSGTITVASTSGFPSSGTLVIVDDPTTREGVAYTSKDAGHFFGCSRGRLGFDGAHATGLTVRPYLAGIYLTCTPLFGTFPPALDDDYDMHQTIEHVFVESPGTDGIAMAGRSESRMLDIQVYRAGHFGYRPGTDFYMVACTAGNSDAHGFHITGGGTLVGCKSFWSGLAEGASNNGHGFNLFGTGRGTGTSNVTLAGCIAQDNRNSGFMFDNCDGTVVSACTADSNNYQNNGSVGFDFWAATNNVLTGCSAFERNALGSPYQLNALRLRTGSVGNKIGLTHKAVSGVTLQAPVAPGSTVTGNDISINGMGSLQTLTWTSTVTPDPYAYTTAVLTLGGPTTIANPTYAHADQPLRFILIQDATGGRPVSWGSGYVVSWIPNTAPNARTTIEFRYDGVNWLQTSAMPQLVTSQRSVQATDTRAGNTAEALFATNCSIPANSLKVGQVLDFVAYGPYSTHSAGTWSLRLRVLAGSTVLLDTTAVTTASSIANRLWKIEGKLIVTAIGAAGTVEAQGEARVPNANTITGAVLPGLVNTAAITLDTTVAQTLQIGVTHGGTNANNTATMRSFVVQALDQ